MHGIHDENWFGFWEIEMLWIIGHEFWQFAYQNLSQSKRAFKESSIFDPKPIYSIL